MKIFIGIIAAFCLFVFAGVASAETFKTNLSIGSTGPEVVELQTWLERNADLKIPIGIPKGYFGQITLWALVRYQLSQNITPSAGYFGPITRAKINQILAVTEDDDQCSTLSSTHFRALTKDEVGISPDGIVLGYWGFSFGLNTFIWNHSDVSERGAYSCKDNVLHLEFSDRRSEKNYDAYYNPGKMRLTFLGKEYAWVAVPHQ